MIKKYLKVSLALGILCANILFATDPKLEREEFDINSILYIEEDAEIDLGFNTADYLPEDFNPYQHYFNINSIVYIEEEVNLGINSKSYLPEGFDAYANSFSIDSFNYIDICDNFELDFDSKTYLPQDFNPYDRAVK